MAHPTHTNSALAPEIAAISKVTQLLLYARNRSVLDRQEGVEPLVAGHIYQSDDSLGVVTVCPDRP